MKHQSTLNRDIMINDPLVVTDGEIIQPTLKCNNSLNNSVSAGLLETASFAVACAGLTKLTCNGTTTKPTSSPSSTPSARCKIEVIPINAFTVYRGSSEVSHDS